MWSLFKTIAAVATGAPPFLTKLTGSLTTAGFGTFVALALILLSTPCNLGGIKFRARVATFGFICELVGALAVGGHLLLFHRVQPIGGLIDPMSSRQGGHYLPAFLAAAQLGLFSCYGFEACVDVADEIGKPGLRVPRSMRMTIYVGIGASIFACLALLLAVPDIDAVISGRSPTPLADVLLNTFGPLAAKWIAANVMVSFMSSTLSL